MNKYNKHACTFCGHPSGEWQFCPSCSAPKHRISIWLVDRWNVDVARNYRTGKPMKGTCMYDKQGKFWNRLRNFPAALFDSQGYVFFETESQYLNHPDLNVGEKTNTVGRKKISQFDDYVTGKPLL